LPYIGRGGILGGKSFRVKGNIREKKSNFSDTLYAKSWKSLLHSERLKNLIKEFGYRVIFFPILIYLLYR